MYELLLVMIGICIGIVGVLVFDIYTDDRA